MAVRVRYAPSPTGRQHVGNIRTALFSYLFARSNKGKFILRIEDTDQKRLEISALEDIYESLSWLGLNWDEGPRVGGPFGPYVQSERKRIYHKISNKLISDGKAYCCFCSAQRLENVRNHGHGYDRHCRNLDPIERERLVNRNVPSVVRFKVPLDGKTVIPDKLLGSVERQNADLNPDPVLIKSDGFPTYHLASVVDDHEMRITHVFRSQEWLSSGPLHMLIFQACNWDPPFYIHLPTVNGEDGKKLSKRHGATSIDEFRNRGFLPEALINYLAMLGWAPIDKQEVFSIDQLEHVFDIKRLVKGSAIFDYQKLEWFNGQHLRSLSPTMLVESIRPYLKLAGIKTLSLEQEIGIAELLRNRITLLEQVEEKVSFLNLDYSVFANIKMPQKVSCEKAIRLLEQVVVYLEDVNNFSDSDMETWFRQLAVRENIKFGDLMMTIRLAVIGTKVSPPLIGSLRLLGKVEIRERIEHVLAILKNLDEEELQ